MSSERPNFYKTMQQSLGRRVQLKYKQRSRPIREQTWIGRIVGFEPTKNDKGQHGVIFKLREGYWAQEENKRPEFNKDWHESKETTELALGPFAEISTLKVTAKAINVLAEDGTSMEIPLGEEHSQEVFQLDGDPREEVVRQLTVTLLV